MTKKEAPRGPDGEISGWKHDPEMQQMKEKLSKLKLSDRAWNRLVKSVMYLQMVRHPGRIHKFPELREFLNEQENRTGLLTGAIFNQDLFAPTVDESQLEYKTTRAGTWLGYDFDRPKQFGEKVKEAGKQHKQGRLLVFDLDEVADHSAEEYTPTGFFNLFNPNHLLQFDILPVSELIAKGYVAETTYNAAFERAGLTDKYREDLEQMGEHKIYVITPKGNGLVFLEMGESGEKKPKEERQKQSIFGDIFVPRPVPNPI